MADLDAYGSAIAACLELTFQRADEVTYLFSSSTYRLLLRVTRNW
jgi:hypothetical protein